mmetsp:Transcript_29737/g.68967  ORF Transcript_29737/g.68967 Transcript_29737/m.68967 type:complete len:124 (-) Transcript_29737:70-441(-)
MPSAKKHVAPRAPAKNRGARGAQPSVVPARARGAKASVFAGRRTKTSGGLRKEHLVKNKEGRVVAKSLSKAAAARWNKNPMRAWVEATRQARQALGIKGFVPIGGVSATGRALYAKAKQLLGE